MGKAKDNIFDISKFQLDPKDQEIFDFYSNWVKGDNRNFEILYKDTLLAKISFSSEEATVEQLTDHVFYRQFKQAHPTKIDVDEWLRRRCFPKERYNRKQLMHDLRLGRYQHSPYEYMLILKQTHGILLEDYIWIRFAGEDLTYGDVKVRD